MMDNQFEKQDPTKQYPTISPSEDQQPEPGLDAKLSPQADHGEDTYRGLGRMRGRKALITGGDSGIGRAVAIAFAKEGADVVINYLPSEQIDADEVIKVGEDAGVRVVGIPGDLTDESFCRELVERTVEEIGGIDVLVNNAGKQVSIEDVSDISTKQLVDTFTVNVYAMVWITQQALRYMKKGAAIINTTSIQAYQPSPDKLDYAMTKASIANFTKGLSAQLASKGIRVNGVAPGPIWTPLQPSYGQPPEKLPSFGKDTPLGRAGQPAELASTYVFLATQESSYITGEIIGVTGGDPIS